MARRRVFVVWAIVLAIASAACSRSPEARKTRHMARGDAYFEKSSYDDAIIEYMNVVQIDPESAVAFRRIGLSHYHLGQFGQAFRYLLKAQQLDPNDLETRIKLGTLYLGGRKFDEARDIANFVLDKDPNHFDGLLLIAGTARTRDEVDDAIERLEAVRDRYADRAKLHLAIGALHAGRSEPEAAERSFLEAVKVEPDSVEAHMILGEFYGARKQTEAAEKELRKAADLAPVAGSLARLRLADFYLTIGRRDEARDVLEETTQKVPDSVPAWRRLAELEANENKYDEALQVVETIMKLKPDDIDGRYLRGRILLARGDIAAASQELRSVIKAEPTFAPARYNLAIALLKEGKAEEAKAELREALDAVPGFPQATILLASMNLKNGAYQLVIDDLERFLKEGTESSDARVLLGTAYLARNEPARAAEIFAKITEIDPQSPKGPHYLGVAALARGKTQEAKDKLEAALALSPGYLPALAQLVSILNKENAPEAAIARVEKEAERAPNSGEIQVLLGNLHLGRGNHAKAEDAYRLAMEIDPSRTDSYTQLARLYAASGRYDEALARLEQAREKNPKAIAIHMLIGTVHETRGRYAESQRAYEKALELDPRFVPAANNLAYLYSEHGGDREKALQLAQLAREQRPEDPSIADTLGWILYKRGVYDRALKLLTESAATLTDHPEVQYHLGMTHHRLGNAEAAKQSLERALQLAQNFRGADEAKKVLSEIN
jgi:tetratricopeptide (TPR) repeat protein